MTAIIVLLAIVYSCNSDKSDKDKEKDNQKTNKTDPVKPEPKDQYRMGETYEGNKDQMVDLIEGTATFDITYQGDSHFNATLKNGDGTVVAVLADVDGNYKGTKSINVPKTNAYVLAVTCKGSWSVAKK